MTTETKFRIRIQLKDGRRFWVSSFDGMKLEATGDLERASVMGQREAEKARAVIQDYFGYDAKTEAA